MPRPTYGAAVKSRSLALLALLLDFANDELEIEESAIERLRSQIQLSWQSDQRLVVRTKVRSLAALSNLSATPLTPDQIKESLRRLGDYLEILEDNRPNASGAETWHFTLRLWHSRRDRTALLQRFEQEWESRRSPTSAPLTDVWLKRCADLLTLNLTTNPLMVRDRISFEWRSLYVPLGIIARSPLPQLSEEEPEPIAAEPPRSPQQFLAQLLRSESSRIAIVGEPGSGKTTLLQNLAQGLIQAEQLPIWISLADLQGATLEQFLLNDWLKLALQQFAIAPEVQQDFAAQMPRVWLLLDAIDEMTLEPSAALGAIARQLRGWLGQAQVILTCRSHVWDSAKNSLEDFECYSNLPFQAETQTFIQQWFGESELGDRLWAELNKPDRCRIRDAVNNPLRLALLCRTWTVHQGFPTTKAMLYQQFVEALYDWKQDRLPTSLSQRQQLNQCLGELAIAALQQPQIKFRLPQSFILKVWSNLELLALALNLGWLTQVGTRSGSGEKIYAFYHPTFQEYFAAQAIDDWQPFELLDPQWREVILFWLGRSDLDAAQKDAVMQALYEFSDSTGYYRPQAYCLAAAGLAEFPDSQFASAIALQLLHWRFGHYHAEQEVWQWYPVVLQTASLTGLMQMDRSVAIAAYERYLQQEDGFFAQWQAAYSLGNAIAPQHPLALSVLQTLLKTAESVFFKIRLCEHLARLYPADPTAVTTLRTLLVENQEDGVRRKVAHCLVRIEQNPDAIAVLEHLAQTADPPIQRQAAASLVQLMPGHPLGVAERSAKKRRAARAERSQLSLDRESEALALKLQQPCSLNARIRYAYRLGRILPGHPVAIDTLLSVLVEAGHEPSIYRQVADCLNQVLTPENWAVAIAQLHPLTPQNVPFTAQTAAIYSLLWDIAQQIPPFQFSASID